MSRAAVMILGIPLFFLLIGLIIYAIQEQLASNKKSRYEEELRRIQEKKESIRSQLENLISDEVKKHFDTLLVTYNQSVYRDKYGNWKYDKWERECEYFLTSTVGLERMTDDYEGENFNYFLNFLHKEIEDDYRVLKARTALETDPVDVETLSPREFENFCASLLTQSGWSVQTTKATGDQGVDIIAKFGEVKAVFQCKLYSSNIGNKAVQEIYAGKTFESAHIACVVSNQDYTISARQLAGTNGVHLLHYSQLLSLKSTLGISN